MSLAKPNPLLLRAVESGSDHTLFDQTKTLTMRSFLATTVALGVADLAAGAIGWSAVAQASAIGPVLLLAALVVFIGSSITFAFVKGPARVLSVVLTLSQGFMAGAATKVYGDLYQGVVPMALGATVCTFLAMLFLYASRIVKVTQKFRSVMIAALVGYFLFSLVNLGYAMITDTPFGFGGTGPIGIAISVFATVLAAMTLLLDFDSIDNGINSRTPNSYALRLSASLLTTIVWIYLDLLRLFARIASNSRD